MPRMPWYDAIERIKPHIVRINTPDGHGTGFMIWNNAICSIATALHVVREARFWGKQITIVHDHSGRYVDLGHEYRAIYPDAISDTAAIAVAHGTLPLPEDPLELIPKNLRLKVGKEIGWLGYPGITMPDPEDPSRPPKLCFFTGTVSACVMGEREPREAVDYFVDGVAIPGVSGGPAFYVEDAVRVKDAIRITGVVTELYSDEFGRGLSFVRDVDHLQTIVSEFKSLGQAREAAKNAPAVTTRRGKRP